MTAKRHIVRGDLICTLLLIVLTIFGAAASAQDYGTDRLSAAVPGSTGNAMSSGASVTPMQSSSPAEAITASQAGITATLLGVPVYGKAPLMVDFYIGLASPYSSLVYKWNFGDGAVSLLPAGVYVLHLYQHPGTYSCSLELTTAQGRSITLFTMITVQPSHS